jgi:hypothetical protein
MTKESILQYDGSKSKVSNQSGINQRETKIKKKPKLYIWEQRNMSLNKSPPNKK